LLLKYGADVNSRNRVDGSVFKEGGLTPICYARDIKAVEILMKNKADLDVKTFKGQTLLEYFIKHGYIKIVKLLIKADVNVKDFKGLTSLHYSTQVGLTKIVKLLLKHKADANVKSNTGETPLHYASKEGHIEITELLIRHGADVNVKNNFGQTPLFTAVDTHKVNIKMVEVLLKHKADVNAKDRWGSTALHDVAFLGGRIDMARLLLKYKADINIKNNSGFTPLDMAEMAGSGNSGVKNLLSKYGGRKGQVINKSDVTDKKRDLFYRTQLDRLHHVIADTDRYKIYSMGDFEFLSLSPDFQSNLTVQTGNRKSKTKVEHKTAADISNNYIGLDATAHLPRWEIGDQFPWVPAYMIDGNRSSGWMGKGWVRLDLPQEISIKRISIWTCYSRPFEFERSDIKKMKADLDIQVSRDSVDWKTVISKKGIMPNRNGSLGDFNFKPVKAKQIKLLLPKLPCWGISEIKIYNNKGENVALLSRGTNVTTSFPKSGMVTDYRRFSRRWPFHWLIGAKWLRVGYWGGPTNWHEVEKVKGKLYLDPVIEEAVKLAADRGLKVTLNLAYGNPLYQPMAENTKPWYMPIPKRPKSIKAFLYYCQYMAKKFKNYVNYYEIWNEQDGYWDAEEFAFLADRAAKAVKEIDPEAKVIMGGTGFLNSEWIYRYLKAGGGKNIDVIAYHPYKMSSQPEDAIHIPGKNHYVTQLKDFMKETGKLGFRGTFMANELGWSAKYPQVKDTKGSRFFYYDVTELTKAKYLVRSMVLHSSLGIQAFINESWTSSSKLVRYARSYKNNKGYRVFFITPQASFYAMRTISSVMDGAEPVAVPIKIRTDIKKEYPLEAYTFSLPDNQRLLALWIWRKGEDDWPGIKTDVTLEGVKARRVIGVDTLNGFEQELKTRITKNGILLRGLRIKDYPLILRLEK
jgi:ankyrin repeat protein